MLLAVVPAALMQRSAAAEHPTGGTTSPGGEEGHSLCECVCVYLCVPLPAGRVGMVRVGLPVEQMRSLAEAWQACFNTFLIDLGR